MQKQTLLFAAADEQRVARIRHVLGQTDLDARLAAVFSWEAAQAALLRDDYDLYLLDQALVADEEASWAMRADTWSGRRWLLVLDEEDPAQVDAALRAGAADFLTLDTLDRRQLDRAVRYAAARSPRPHQQVRDVMYRIRSVLTQTRERLTKQKALVVLHEEIALFAGEETTTPEDVLKVALDAVCTYLEWPVGHVYLVENKKLVSSDIWHFDDPEVFSALYQATKDTSFTPGDASLPGQVFDNREAVWIRDLEANHHFQRMSNGQSLAVKAAFGVPVLMDDAVVAVLEFFSPAVQPVDALLLDSMEVIGIQIGRVFERERASKALQATGDRLRVFTEMAVEAVITADHEGCIVDWNKGAAMTFGYDARQAVGRPLTMLMPPPHRDAFAADLTRFRETGDSRYIGQTTEIEGVRKGGEAFPIEFSLASWQIGEETYFGSIIRDITERKKALQAARESQAFTEAILASLQDLIAVLDKEGTIIAVNEAWKKMARQAGAALENIGPGINYLEVCRRGQDQADKSAEAAIFGIESVLSGSNDYFEFEYPCHTPDRKQWYRMAVMPLRGKGGAVVSHSDVTERSQAEEALRESEERFMLAVRGSHSGIWDWPDVDEDAMWWSPRYYELLGYDDGEIEATMTRFEALLHPADRTRTFDLLQAHFDEKVPFDIEYRLRTKADTYRWFRARGEALRGSQGRPVRMAGSLTDVDERKKAEAAVQQSHQQLRQLAARLEDVRERERTRLSREVHDVLGQALTGLRMDVAMIEKGLTDEQQALQEHVDAMKEAISETVQVVRRIAHELRPGILDDLGVLAAIEWEAERFASRTDIACMFVEDVEALGLDRSRSTAVFRVFQEIMTNVARHADATEVIITATERNGCFTLIVQDNGRGIREEDLQNATSLGLLGMRERLFPWGGQVDFAGAPDEGTTVTVTLPLTHTQPAD